MKKKNKRFIIIGSLFIAAAAAAVIFRDCIFDFFDSTFIPIGPGGLPEDLLTADLS